jgi:acyl-CoA synthetase (AMP-forming)/AMP-acid ligase II
LGSIGKAGFNWEARIVNERGEERPEGQIGEIAVKGNGVMREFYRNPERTRETIKNGWLFTGDMGRMDSEGYIWIVDRKKDVIISGGENVYSTEVEEVLHGHPSIQDVAVIGLPDERLGEIVAAVVELKGDAPESMDLELSRYCEEMLPKYKRPRRFLFDIVPRNVLGKIDKVKIREAHATTKNSKNKERLA